MSGNPRIDYHIAMYDVPTLLGIRDLLVIKLQNFSTRNENILPVFDLQLTPGKGFAHLKFPNSDFSRYVDVINELFREQPLIVHGQQIETKVVNGTPYPSRDRNNANWKAQEAIKSFDQQNRLNDFIQRREYKLNNSSTPLSTSRPESVKNDSH